MNRREYIDALRGGLDFLPPQELSEIIEEFEQHFEVGLSQGIDEQDLIVQLGAPARIVDAYKTEVTEGIVDAPKPASHTGPKGDAAPPRGTLSTSRGDIHAQYPLVEVECIEIGVVESNVLFESGQGDQVRVDIEGGSGNDITVEQIGHTLHIKQPFRFFRLLHWNHDPDIKITLPPGYTGAMRVGTTTGDIRLPSFKGESLQLESVSGKLRAGDVYVNEALVLKDVSASIKIGKTMADRIRINTTSGNLKMDSIAAKDVNINTVSGDIRQAPGSVWDASSLHIKTVSGDIDAALSDHWRKLDFHTVSGDIKLVFPKESAPFEVQMDSLSGKIKNQLPNIPGCGRFIKAHTISGDLHIRVG